MSKADLSPLSSLEKGIERLYGPGAIERFYAPAISHVTALWKNNKTGILSPLAITPQTPRNEDDDLALQLSRSRSDAIVTTGKILRDEEALLNNYAWGCSLLPSEHIHAWRSAQGKDAPPYLVILSRGDIDFRHPVFSSSSLRLLIVTGPQGYHKLTTTQKAPTNLAEIISHERPSILSALEHLRAVKDCRHISIEAGAKTASQLYQGSTSLVSQLLLSEYTQPLPATLQTTGALFSSRSAMQGFFPEELQNKRPNKDDALDNPWVFSLRYRD